MSYRSACFAILISCLSAACADQHQVAVELTTDFVPQDDFASVRTEVDGQTDRYALQTDANFEEGERIAFFNGVNEGEQTLTVALLDEDDDVLTSRSVLINVEDTQLVRVAIAKSCTDITCGAGEECLAGVCLPSECLEDSTAPGCPDACEGSECEDHCTQTACEGELLCNAESGECVEHCSQGGCEAPLLCNAQSGVCIENHCLQTGCEPPSLCHAESGACLEE